jgi:hypothetical protein
VDELDLLRADFAIEKPGRQQSYDETLKNINTNEGVHQRVYITYISQVINNSHVRNYGRVGRQESHKYYINLHLSQ